MWIFFPDAMLSFVAHHDKPEFLMVRARIKGDIDRIFPGAKVSRTPRADYLYRATVHRERVGRILTDHAATMGYTNVKGAIPAGDDRRKRAMHDVWQVMFDAQHQAATAAALEPAPAPPDLRTGQRYLHTTSRGEPRTVEVMLVQERMETSPLVTLLFLETYRYFSLPLKRAQSWLRNSELLP